MVFGAFQEEMEKIARSRRGTGGIDLSRIHEQNLKAQRDDLLQAENPYAYVQAGATGALAGTLIPSFMMASPVLADMKALETNLRKTHLTNVLAKAIKGNPKLLAGKSSDQASQMAAQMAAQYYAIPETLRKPGSLEAFRHMQGMYPDPEGVKWTAPASSLPDIDIMKDVSPRKVGKNLLLSERDVEIILLNKKDIARGHVNNMASENLRKAEAILKPGKKVLHPEIKITFPDPPKTNSPFVKELEENAFKKIREGVESMVRRSPFGGQEIDFTSTVEAGSRTIRGSVFDEDAFKKVLKPYSPSAGNSGIPTSNDIKSLIQQITNKHGKTKVPTPSSIKMDLIVKALKRSKVPLMGSAVLGTAAGLASVRRRRRHAKELRS